MASLNAAVPPRVRRLAAELHPRLTPFDSVRDRHSLLVKRLGDDEPLTRLRERLRPLLARTDPINVVVTGIDTFEDPPVGAAPVVYLAVESPGLDRLHRRLVDEFGAIRELEGESYEMHVTLARGGDPEAAAALTDRDVSRLEWTVDELELYDSQYDAAVARLPLG
ncbi:MAG: 2'-5' RNA ligase family protein [Halolamina sp.]